MSPAISRSSEVLPAPEGPTRASSSPAAQLKLPDKGMGRVCSTCTCKALWGKDGCAEG